MHPSLAQVHDRIELQKSALPQMYGDVDFTQTPERYTQDVAESSLPPSLHNMAPPPADMVARVKAYTMLGDVTADAYAALMGEYGFRRLVDMLTTACDEGLEAVPDAPPELVALITEMDRIAAAREESQPLRSKTGGSTFKNPPGAKAWRLIDEAGCRGLRHGGAQVSEQHCNFLINTGTASAADLENLGELVRQRVRAHCGTDLEWEIKRIGVPLGDGAHG